MKFASKTITTLLCVFALLASILPQTASEHMPDRFRPNCTHSCCAHAASMSCCATVATREIAPATEAKALAGSACTCQLQKDKQYVPAPVAAPHGTARAPMVPPPAIQIEPSLEPIEASVLVAIDSGPPRAPPFARDFGRAPPMA